MSVPVTGSDTVTDETLDKRRMRGQTAEPVEAVHERISIRSIRNEFQRDFRRIESHRPSRKHDATPAIHADGINARADAREMGGADYQARMLTSQLLAFDEIIRENHRLPPFSLVTIAALPPSAISAAC